MARFTKSLFFKAKDKKLARKVRISSPSAFRTSINVLKRGGITLKEKRALVLARTRAKVQLRRKNLSIKERRQFGTIAKMRVPNVSKPIRRRRGR